MAHRATFAPMYDVLWGNSPTFGESASRMTAD